MACRDMERAQAAAKEVVEASGNDNVVCMKLDLADTKSIREFAEAFIKGCTVFKHNTHNVCMHFLFYFLFM